MSDEGVEQPAPRRRRGFESAGDMVRSLTVVLVIVLIVVALNLRQDPDSPVRRFDYSVALQQARVQAPFDVTAPQGLPRAWRATSGRLGVDRSAGGSAGTSPVTWHIGFVTPKGEYAALEQSDGDPGRFLARFSDGAQAAGRVRIDGAMWRRVEGGEPEPRALVLEGAVDTTLVVGGAGWGELRRLAASLQRGPAG